MTTEMALPGMTIWDDDDDMKGRGCPAGSEQLLAVGVFDGLYSAC